MRVNGTTVHPDDPSARLLDYLRDDLGLRAAKEGCGMGECGSCTVLMDGHPVCACLVLMGQAADADIVTAEALEGGDPDGRPGLADRLRGALVAGHAPQCGFCIPGLMVSAHAVLAEHFAPTEEQICCGLEGNLCRCTGYRSIVEAIQAVKQ
ncbi:MAG: (2Fe-2S)-binding protein [Nakamurella sp.]